MHVLSQCHEGVFVVGTEVAKTIGAVPYLAARHFLVDVEDVDGFFEWISAEDGRPDAAAATRSKAKRLLPVLPRRRGLLSYPLG